MTKKTAALLLDILIPTIFAASASTAFAEEPSRFFSHLTTPAATAESGELAFQAFPGANGLQSPLLNALDIGIAGRLEVGTAPIFYFSPDHRYNFNGKINFFKSRALHLAVGGSRFGFATYETQNGSGTRFNLTQTYGLAVANLFFTDSLAVGANVAKPWIKTDSPLLAAALDKNLKTEWFVDFSLRLSRHFAFTPGFGIARLETLNPWSKVPFGVGGTLTWIGNKTSTFTEFSVGYHFMPIIHSSSFLFSFSI